MMRQPPSHWQRLQRYLRHSFLVPLLRGRRQPELAARATAVGLFWAFTPTFGLRMPLVFITWLVARHLLRTDFTLVIGLAWTWATNALVILPLYFGFYLTGRALQGDVAGLMSFDTFRASWAPLVTVDLGQPEQLYLALRDWGLVLWLGALPWAVVMACLGYSAAARYLRSRKTLHRARGDLK